MGLMRELFGLSLKSTKLKTRYAVAIKSRNSEKYASNFMMKYFWYSAFQWTLSG